MGNNAMTEWKHRIVIVVEWDKRDTANNQAKAWDPAAHGEETFGEVRLSADGTEPPTHTACNTKTTDSIRANVLDAMDNVPFVDVYEAQEGEGAYEVWQRALEELGIEVISEDV